MTGPEIDKLPEKLASIVRSLPLQHQPPTTNDIPNTWQTSNGAHLSSAPTVTKASRITEAGQASALSEVDLVSVVPSSQIPPPVSKRHGYDSKSGRVPALPLKDDLKSPIPPPILYVRSEYPTITRTRGQQSLTCLITVEIPEGNWKPDIEDFKACFDCDAEPREAPLESALLVARNDGRTEKPYEIQEELDFITQDLLSRVDNWHGLDFNRYVRHGMNPESMILNGADLGSCGCMARSTLARTDCHGRNWSVISSRRCLFASKRRKPQIGSTATV